MKYGFTIIFLFYGQFVIIVQIYLARINWWVGLEKFMAIMNMPDKGNQTNKWFSIKKCQLTSEMYPARQFIHVYVVTSASRISYDTVKKTHNVMLIDTV